MVVLYCRECHEGYRHHGGETPRQCPRCGVDVDEWLTYQEVTAPKKDYELTVKDIRFLRSLRIDPEWPFLDAVE